MTTGKNESVCTGVGIVIPEGWQIKKLQDCLERIIDYRGKSTPKDNSGIPLITARNVRDGFLDFTTQEYMSVDDYERWMTRGFPQAGDLLFTTEAPLGKVALFPDNGTTYALAQRLVTLRVNEKLLDSRYLMYYFLSNFGSRRVQILATGTTATGIRQSELRKVSVIFPPLPEQRRIAEILSIWDEAITLTEQLIAAKQRRKKALMQQLLTGRRRFREFVCQNDYRTAFNTEVPVDWDIFEFGEFVKKSEKKFDPQKTNTPVPCVELEHISQETGRIIGHVSSVEQNSIKNYFSAGQVLFGKLRPYLRKYARPQFDGACSSEIWVLSSRGNLCDNNFLFYLVQSDRFLSAANVTSGTKMPRSDWNYVSEFVFAIPPIEEQRKIAAVLQACDEEIELLGQKLAALKRQKRGLMQQLLTGRVRVMPSPPTPLPGGEGPGVRAKSLTPPWSIGPGNYAAR